MLFQDLYSNHSEQLTLSAMWLKTQTRNLKYSFVDVIRLRLTFGYSKILLLKIGYTLEAMKTLSPPNILLI